MRERGYKYVMGQGDLMYLYERGKALAACHPDIMAERRKVIERQKRYATEKEALTAALKLKRANPLVNCQIWASYERDEEYFRITSWLVTNDNVVKQAADYVGMAHMYDDSRLQIIIDDNVSIDDVVAYK